MRALPTCFVMMPYGKRPVEAVDLDFDVLFDEFIGPATRLAGFDVVRGDREVASGVIMPRLSSSIYSADLVIADITYQNPNVYYELGLRHALSPQGTLLIQRSGGDLGALPLSERRRGADAKSAFDIEGVTIWPYDVSRRGLKAAQEGLRQQIERVAGAVKIDSPAFLYLEGLRVVTGSSPRALARENRTYELLSEAGEPTGRFVGYRSGDLKELREERAVASGSTRRMC